MSDLLDDLAAAEGRNWFQRGCEVCHMLAKIDDEVTRSALERALDGTIGIKKLSAILKRHGYVVSARQITNHRNEKRP